MDPGHTMLVRCLILGSTNLESSEVRINAPFLLLIVYCSLSDFFPFALQVAELLGFRACIISCLDYLEAVPWVGEEEENVISSVRNLQSENYGVSPVLKRVASDLTTPPNDTFSHIIELVLRSNEDRGRREMKSLVQKLLKENSTTCTSGSSD